MNTLKEFETLYHEQYGQELAQCDSWIKWCKSQTPPDTHGINFYQGMRSALIFNDIKMYQLLQILNRMEGSR